MMHKRVSSRGIFAILVTGVFLVGSAAAQERIGAGEPDDPCVPGSAPEIAADPCAAVYSDAGFSGGEAFFAKIAEGGFAMILLLGLSIVMVAVAVERLLVLRKQAFVPEGVPEIARQLWANNQMEQLRDLCLTRPSIYSRVVRFLTENSTDNADLLEREAEELAQQDIWIHLQRTRPLSVVGALAPLLGLFGTVLGMIESFDKVALMGEMGDASVLAGGISKALLTTAGGLVVAIPAIALYHYFRGRTEMFAHQLECEITELLRRHVRRTEMITESSSPKEATLP